MAEVDIKKIDAFFEAAGKNAVVATAETSKGESFLVLTAAAPDVAEESGEDVQEDDAKETPTAATQTTEEKTAEVVSSSSEEEDDEGQSSESDQENTDNEPFTLRLRLKNNPFYKSEYIHLSDKCVADIQRFMVTAGMAALGWIMGWTIGLSTGAAAMHRC
jgi:hypothetical protein